MNDQARVVLKDLLEQEGRDVYKNPQKLKGKLQDHCVNFPAEKSALIYALDERVPDDLVHASPNIPIGSSISTIVHRLDQNGVIGKDKARWAVESWAFALCLLDQSGLQQLSGQKPAGDREKGRQPGNHNSTSLEEKGTRSGKNAMGDRTIAPKSPTLAYRLLAFSLGVVVTGICVLIVMHSLAGYHPNSTVCYQALLSSTSVDGLPGECQMPIGQWVISVLVLIGGLRAAVKVWSRA